MIDIYVCRGFDGTRNAHRWGYGQAWWPGSGRACSIARAVLVDVPRRLVGQELVVLDGARAGLAAHGALLVRPGAVRHDARGHRPVRSIRGERECHAVEDVAVASLGPDPPVEGRFACS